MISSIVKITITPEWVGIAGLSNAFSERVVGAS